MLQYSLLLSYLLFFFFLCFVLIIAVSNCLWALLYKENIGIVGPLATIWLLKPLGVRYKK